MNQFRKNKELGAIMLEASLGFLVLFAIVFTMIEFARYATMTAALQASADEALALAQTVPGIDSADSSERSASQAKINALATRIATKTFFNSASPSVTLTIPTPAPGDGSDTEEQRRKALEKDPITIELEASVPSIAGNIFGNAFKVRAKAIGFREPRNPFSEPEPLDCKGNPVVAGAPPPTDCKCPGAETTPDVTYNPSWSKCTCNTPNNNLTYTPGFPLSFLEQGLEFDPASASCKCPGDWIDTNPANGEPAGKCKCSFTDASCEDFNRDWRGRLGAGAHVKTRFNGYNVCECASPCETQANPYSWYGITGSTWDNANQRCECVPPSNWQDLCQIGWKQIHGGQAYPGNFGLGPSCACAACGAGKAQGDFLTADYAFGCDCSDLPPCQDPTANHLTYAQCGCYCPGDRMHVLMPDGSKKCPPPGCNPGNGSCYLDTNTGEIKVCESGGLCSNTLPYVLGD